MAIFVIIDPFSMVPIFLTLTDRFKLEEKHSIRNKSTLIALCTLLVFAFTGMAVFNFFGITLPAFQIAGGILLLLMGIDQLRATAKRVNHEETDEGLHKDDISVFPMATPLLAGPGAISTVVLQGGKAVDMSHQIALAGALFAAMAATSLVLKLSPYLYRMLGKIGLNLMAKIMGLMLTAIAVQYIITGLAEAFKLVR